MTAAALLSDLSASGVAVRIDAAGQLKASGDQAALARWLPEIRTRKAELMAMLAANDDQDHRHRLWLIEHADGMNYSHSFTPPATLAEVQGWYPGCLIEPVTETKEQRP